MTFKLLDRLHYKQEKEVSRNESEASVKIKYKKGWRKSMKEKSKISVISKAVEEPVELEFGGKRNRKNKIIGIMELYSI